MRDLVFRISFYTLLLNDFLPLPWSLEQATVLYRITAVHWYLQIKTGKHPNYKIMITMMMMMMMVMTVVGYLF